MISHFSGKIWRKKLVSPSHATALPTSEFPEKEIGPHVENSKHETADFAFASAQLTDGWLVICGLCNSCDCVAVEANYLTDTVT